MKYAKIVNNIVEQIQPNQENGFIEVPDDVVCGMIKNTDGTFSVVPKTAEEIIEQLKKEMESAIQSHIDSQAQSLGYDGIVSACSYAGYTNEFQTEAIALGVWRSAVWTKAYQVQADVEAGIIPMPTVDELIAMLPVFGV